MDFRSNYLRTALPLTGLEPEIIRDDLRQQLGAGDQWNL